MGMRLYSYYFLFGNNIVDRYNDININELNNIDKNAFLFRNKMLKDNCKTLNKNWNEAQYKYISKQKFNLVTNEYRLKELKGFINFKDNLDNEVTIYFFLLDKNVWLGLSNSLGNDLTDRMLMEDYYIKQNKK